ncbi:choice-of-anchor D domain-containing protein [Marinobacter sp. SS13-12]|uniref:choice-of-anchor D domain-containing protein n=1 Tax=Marinobacter sp. SS13-12 TaxID=3050451 RepID=UPI0025557E84|nr:choice-of-anchor D domain-containing protein [Marinobacter sp. SS13-12]MDK8464843.1 choice-of-anchor D domain-containing protein [Marinobacter sp. SS13-12]
MKLRKPNKSVRTFGTAIAAAALMTGGGNAFAEPVSLELEFTCPFPLIGDQPIRAQISADVPTQATVGQPTPEFTVDALTTVNEDSRLGLKLVGSATIEGTATNETTVVTPNREIDLTVPLTIPQSPIPDETGEFTVPAQGTSPAITFNEDDVGEAVITIGGLTLDMIARVENGDIAPAPIGEFTSACVQNPGQDNILQTLQVVPDEQFEPRIAVSPESIDFGNVQAGTTAEEVVTISNTGQAELGINNISLGGTDAAAFTQTNSCTTVAAGESCDVAVTYIPDGEGDQNAVLNIESGDTETPLVDVPLTGTSVLAPVPEIVVTPEDISFGTVMLGETASAEVTISNEGNESLVITGIDISGGNSSDFIQTNDCTTVAPEEACTVAISFTPSATGGRSASLDIASDDPATPDVSVPLSGQGNDGTGDTLEVLLDLAGQTDIKASGSSLPLSGSIATQLELATGMFEADLALDPTQGQFKIPLLFKSLTANARVEFEQADITTGTLINGNLTANSSLYVKVPKVTVRLFGLKIPVGGGRDCRTADPVSIGLASVEGTNFSLSEGGDVTGNYDLPALQNCGPLTDVLNQFLAGPDNGIDLTLTPNL